jgi:hypothetical protein
MGTDVRITGWGSTIIQFHLLTDTAKAWVDNNVDPEAQFLGDALCVEPRYATDIFDGMLTDGLVLEGL